MRAFPEKKTVVLEEFWICLLPMFLIGPSDKTVATVCVNKRYIVYISYLNILSFTFYPFDYQRFTFLLLALPLPTFYFSVIKIVLKKRYSLKETLLSNGFKIHKQNTTKYAGLWRRVYTCSKWQGESTQLLQHGILATGLGCICCSFCLVF